RTSARRPTLERAPIVADASTSASGWTVAERSITSRRPGPRSASAAATKERCGDAERRAEGDRAAPVEERPDVAVDPAGHQEEHAGGPLRMELVGDHAPHERLLDVDVPRDDVAGGALGQA